MVLEEVQGWGAEVSHARDGSSAGADRKYFLRIYSGDPSSGSSLTFSVTEVGMSSLPRPSAMSLWLFVA